ncbi:hypothetical protein KRX52_11355 [Pseudomonas sp. MAP12]|uniref:Uncharacterized protein n=1 Tax=Geopseudomonas aromaticivorans TaxID=2849492 RepID=A0ABS6MX58_9GAMM|nr:hypothetical protein [Pseudomonas aromaticivorans]MBV2133389.1 hypothetical protein [Pseudomonas aromaticivorans]
MNITALRERIDSALQHQVDHSPLVADLAARIDKLHSSIRLPAEDAPGVLLRFVQAYIERVPAQVEAAAEVASAAGLDAQITPVLRQAAKFLLSPPPFMQEYQGLAATLGEAYLVHRLVEEVNDRYIVHFGQPLIPLDTTVANLVAHQLIGEPLANQLDAAVYEASDTLQDERIFSGDSVARYRAQLAEARQEHAWPCLSHQLGIELQLAH